MQNKNQQKTVQDIANQLKQSPDLLLARLKEAGLDHQSSDDIVTAQDTQKLLQMLQSNKTTPSAVRTSSIKSGQTSINVQYKGAIPQTEESNNQLTPIDPSSKIKVNLDLKTEVSENETEATIEIGKSEIKPIEPVSKSIPQTEQPDKDTTSTSFKKQAPSSSPSQDHSDHKTIKPPAPKTRSKKSRSKKGAKQYSTDVNQWKSSDSQSSENSHIALEKSLLETTVDTNEPIYKITPLHIQHQNSNAFQQRRQVQASTTHQFKRPVSPKSKTIVLTPDSIRIIDLAKLMNTKAHVLIKALLSLGEIVSINESIDIDTTVILAEKLGHEIKIKEENLEEKWFGLIKIEGDIAKRNPIITIMGHVDHGKTSLLDFIRKTKVTNTEAGGITQHIGAYHIDTANGGITFLDTPGHEAFSMMRARGAKATDIVVLVVSVDDSVMPQTEEAILHAQAANVPIIIAVTKIDKVNAQNNLEKIKTDLMRFNIVPDEWGGDNQFVGVSSVTGEGIDLLLETIQLQADLMELQASSSQFARGIVLEAYVDQKLGPIVHAIIQNGTLRPGDFIISGDQLAKVRLLSNEKGIALKEATPSMPVKIFGFSTLPETGSLLAQIDNIKEAETLIEQTKNKSKKQIQTRSLEDPFLQLEQNNKKALNLIIKTDVRGTLEAVLHSVNQLQEKYEDVKLNVVSHGIGAITLSDAAFAQASEAVLIGFNVRADSKTKVLIEKEGLILHYFSVIYHLVEAIENFCSKLKGKQHEEKILGIAQVRQVFNSPKLGQVAGCMVTSGTIHRNKSIRVLREDHVIFEGQLESLRHFKENITEATKGLECGIGVKDYNDIKADDQIEVFEIVEVG